MGKAGSKLRFWTRPFKYFNIEQRARKEIGKEKPKQAPAYPSMEKIMKEIRKDPTLLNKGKPSLDELDKLGQVYLKSTGDNPIIRTATRNPSILRSDSSSSKLPKSTEDVKDPYYGFEEPYIIPKGKLSLRQALDLIGKYQQDKIKWSPEVLSEEFNVDLITTQAIVEHFRSFQVYIPPKPKDPKDMSLTEKAQKFLKEEFPTNPNTTKNDYPSTPTPQKS